MRIAVTYDGGNVFQHFGHTEQFKLYDIEKGAVTLATTINTNDSGHGALADLLKNCKVDALICGGIGGGAKKALAEASIVLYGGVSGSADKAVDDFIANKLAYNSEAECNHHHGEGSSCGDHGHSCGHGSCSH